jgi:hypothetical protein
MYARAIARFASSNATAIAFDDCQLRWAFAPPGQRIITSWIGITAFGQFLTHIMDNPFDRLCRDGDADRLIHYYGGPGKRSGLGRYSGHSMNQDRCQFAGVEVECLPEGGKSPTTFRAVTTKFGEWNWSVDRSDRPFGCN